MEANKLQNSRVLITGGAGLIGSHVADQLITEGVTEIVIFDDFVRRRRKNLAYALTNWAGRRSRRRYTRPGVVGEGDSGSR